MAQEIDLIFETLREIKKANANSSESFERLLTGIVSKLEQVDKNAMSTEFIKSYMAEISKGADERYNVALTKFSDLEKALKAIFNGLDEHVKTKELKELFDIFSTNMTAAYSEIRQQRAILSGLEGKISEMASNKSDKEDILRTITLLRNDFENLNHSYKFTIDSVSTELKNILNGIIQTDQTSINQQLAEQSAGIQKTVSDIYNYLSGIEKRDVQLELLLNKLATEERLKFTQEVIDSIVKRIEEILLRLSDTAERNDIKEVLASTDAIKQQFDEYVTKDIFANAVELSNSIAEKTDDLKQQLGVVTKNIDALPDTVYFEELVKNLYAKLNLLDEEIDKFDSRFILDDISHNVKAASSELGVCKNIITDLNEVVTTKVLEALESISFANEAYDIKNHITEMIKELPQKEDIDRILDSYKATGKTLSELLVHTDKILDKVDKLPTHDDMESLNSNQLGLVENLQEVADKADVSDISSKIDSLKSDVKNINFDVEFQSIYDKTSSIEKWLSNSNLKETTENISEQIKDKPGKEEVSKILETMETLVNSVEELSHNADAKKVKNTLSDVYKLIDDLKNDFISTSEMHNDTVIVNLSELQHRVDSIVSGDEFCTFVDGLKDFMEKVLATCDRTESGYSGIYEYQQAIVNKLEALNTDIIKSILDDVKEDVEEIKNTVDNIQTNVGDVKTHVDSIQDWLTNSKIRENTEELLAQVKEKPDREDVMKVLKVVESIVGELSEISHGDSSQSVNDTITDVCSKIENLKTEFIETSEMQNDAVVEHLSEIQLSIENIVNGEEFETFTDEVKHLLEVIVSNTDKINSDYIAIKEYQVAILDKLDSINIQAIKDIVENRSTVVEDTLTTISEYLTTVNKIDTSEIKHSVLEIKEILESRKGVMDEFEVNSQETIEILENYLVEIKRILDFSDFSNAENVKNKLLQIEEDLLLYKGQNENALTDIIAKLNEYQDYTKTLDEPFSNQDLKSSMQEISEIKDMILALGEAYKTSKYEEESGEKAVADVVTYSLENLARTLDDLTANVESQLQQGFAYNSALLEEKTAMLLEFIQDLRNSNPKNPELSEQLSSTDSKLSDCKQELEFINTDVISSINAKSDKLLEEIAPIRKMLESLYSSFDFSQKLGSDLTELHQSLAQGLQSDVSVPQATLNRLDYTYQQLSADLVSMEDNLKSFVMTDVDSILRKFTELQENVEAAVDSIQPPDAESMQEFKEFAQNIQNFKDSQRELLAEFADDIKDKMQEQHEELKSLLTVSLNNEKIIDAIDELKLSILGKAQEIRRVQSESNSGGTAADAEVDENSSVDDTVSFKTLQSQQDDVSLYTRQLLVEVRSEYNKFAEIIKGLSGENAEIKNILKTIQDKMNNIVVRKGSYSTTDETGEIEITEDAQTDSITDSLSSLDSDENKSVISGEDNFNFIEALDCFKSDVTKLHDKVDTVLSPEECRTTINSVDTQGFVNSDEFNDVAKKVNTILRRINSGEWLEEIKSYISDGKIGTTLELILGKLDILALTDSCEWVQDVKMLVSQLKDGALSSKLDPKIGSMLELLNAKVDILAESDDYELFEELRDMLANSQLESSVETTDLLNLINKKLDVLASPDGDFDLEDLKEKLNIIEDKIDAIVKDDGLTSGVSESVENAGYIDDLMYTLSNVEEKIDKLQLPSENSDIEDIREKVETLTDKLNDFAKIAGVSIADEVKDRLALIEAKIDVIADSSSDVLIDTVNDRLDSIEEKINQKDISTPEFIDRINQKLDLLDAKVDIVASTDSYNDLEDIRLSLENVEENISSVKKYSDFDLKISAILEVINDKIDSLSKHGNEYSQKEFKDVKDLIMAQMDYIDSLENNQKTEAVRKCLKELTVEVNNLNTVQNTKQIQKTIREMKESIMATVVAVFEQVSFVEESEDIKDFVEEKTDEINQNLAFVTDKLKQITSIEDSSDYTYSMQDIESDLAKLRLALKELQTNEQENQTAHLTSLLDNIRQIGSSVSELQNSLSKDEMLGLQLNFERINNDIESLTELSKHMIVASGETYNSLNNNIELFSRTITEQLTTKVDKVTKMLENSNASDAVMRQALIYVGEWIDSASDSMNKISTNSEEIVEVKSVIESLKKDLPEQTNILNSLEEKFDEQQERLAFFETQISKLSGIEDKFEEQQERIDRLEMSIEKILSAVEDIDDSKVTRKIDKIDKQISKLSINIEKLASYVD